jgi:hypothetical protein
MNAASISTMPSHPSHAHSYACAPSSEGFERDSKLHLVCEEFCHRISFTNHFAQRLAVKAGWSIARHGLRVFYFCVTRRLSHATVLEH